MWRVNTTQIFVKQTEQLRISKLVVDSIIRWAREVNLVPCKKFRLVYKHRDIFSVWSVKLPDPDFKKGSRGGFRLICYFVNQEQAVYLDFIERRKELGGKRQKAKAQQKYTEYLNNLKSYLSRHYNS